MTKSNPHIWTKEELTQLHVMWEGHSIEEIADALGKRKKQVIQMAHTIRNVYPGALKSKRSGYENLIDEIFGTPVVEAQPKKKGGRPVLTDKQKKSRKLSRSLKAAWAKKRADKAAELGTPVTITQLPVSQDTNV